MRVKRASGVPSEPCKGLPPASLLKGIEEYNRGEFFACHDTLEALWKAEPRPIRSLYQGILQVGVAWYHLRAGRYRPVVSLLRWARGHLQPFAPVCMGVDVAHLLAGADHCLDEVKRLGPDGVADFDWTLIPRIEMRTEG